MHHFFCFHIGTEYNWGLSFVFFLGHLRTFTLTDIWKEEILSTLHSIFSFLQLGLVRLSPRSAYDAEKVG